MHRPPLFHRSHLGAFAGLVALVVSYLLIDRQLKLVPDWVFPVLILALLVTLIVSLRHARIARTHTIALVIAGLSMVMVASSIGLLVYRLLSDSISASNLLRDAALLWIANVFVFALWYWEIDGGGPAVRHTAGYSATDFAFPQMTLGGSYAENWIPGFTDYLFVAFNASSAFSPTDTLTLSTRAKLLMMAQSLMAIVTLAILVARAVNTFK